MQNQVKVSFTAWKVLVSLDLPFINVFTAASIPVLQSALASDPKEQSALCPSFHELEGAL